MPTSISRSSTTLIKATLSARGHCIHSVRNHNDNDFLLETISMCTQEISQGPDVMIGGGNDEDQVLIRGGGGAGRSGRASKNKYRI